MIYYKMFSPLMCIYQEVVLVLKTWSPDHKLFLYKKLSLSLSLEFAIREYGGGGGGGRMSYLGGFPIYPSILQNKVLLSRISSYSQYKVKSH